jgi:HTH-type transcriptional regulator/antitoxin HipB
MRLSNADELGRYVRNQRKAAGLTQTVLAGRAGVSRRWISDLETGKSTAEVGLVFRVIAALGVFLDVRPQPRQAIDPPPRCIAHPGSRRWS